MKFQQYIIIILLLLGFCQSGFAKSARDTIPTIDICDTLIEYLLIKLKTTYQIQKIELPDSSIQEKLFYPRKLAVPTFKAPWENISFNKTPIQITGGFASYNFLYQSLNDTPFLENNVAQHNALLQLNTTLANFLPVQAKLWSRQTNSHIYRDIIDFQIVYDQSFFGQQLYSQYSNYLLNQSNFLRDEYSEQLLVLQQSRLNAIKNSFHLPDFKQKLVEANEILRVPGITIDPSLPESINKTRTDSLHARAKAFIDTYEQLEKKYRQIEKQVDSLQQLKNSITVRIQTLQNLIQSKNPNEVLSHKWNDSIENRLGKTSLPPLLKWLAGVRQLSIGRTPLNTSELTAKNISVNGLHFEYLLN